MALTAEQADKLRGIVERQGFKFEPRPYTLYFGQKPGLTVAVYEKGPKAVIQGKETADFIQFTLEPEVLGEARLGYEDLHHPERFTPHFGIDESGKGDFFGPLVIAGAVRDIAAMAHLRAYAGALIRVGAQDFIGVVDPGALVVGAVELGLGVIEVDLGFFCGGSCHR